MRYSVLSWLLIPAIALHNFEEWLTLARYGDVGAKLAASLGVSIMAPPAPVITSSLLLVTIVPAILVVAGSVGTPSRLKTRLVCFVASIYLANVFLPHAPVALLVRGYAPGVATALMINLPLCVLLLRQAKRERNLSAREVGVVIGLATFSLPIFIAATLWISGLLVGA